MKMNAEEKAKVVDDLRKGAVGIREKRVFLTSIDGGLALLGSSIFVGGEFEDESSMVMDNFRRR